MSAYRFMRGLTLILTFAEDDLTALLVPGIRLVFMIPSISSTFLTIVLALLGRGILRLHKKIFMALFCTLTRYIQDFISNVAGELFHTFFTLLYIQRPLV